MRGKRIAVFVSSVATVLLMSVGVVHADATPKANNCLGAAFSELVPGETATDPPTYGEVTRGMAKEGRRDDALLAATGALAGCG